MLMPLLESPTLDSQDFNCNYSSDMSKWRYILKPLTQRFVPLGAIGYAGLPDSTGSAPAYSSAPLPLPVQRTLAPGSQRPAPTDSFTGLQRSVNSFSHNFDVPPNHDVNQGLFPIPNSSPYLLFFQEFLSSHQRSINNLRSFQSPNLQYRE